MRAAEFSVSPIRIELKPGTMSETITVINHSTTPLRVSAKLSEWTQDAEGKDVYRDTTELIYFPRQMEVAADSKRLIRIGLKTPAGPVERTYRLFIEEETDPNAPPAGPAQVALRLRFGVPVFVPPAVGKSQFEVMEPVVQGGKLSVVVKNAGNQHARLTRISVTDGAGYTQDVNGWYSLAGSQRNYSVDIPRDICRKAASFSVALEGDNIRFDRKLNVTAADCS